MAFKVKIAGAGGCCPCSQTEGCNCSEEDCGVMCRSKQAICELCGELEFGPDPTVPPRVYRRKVTSGPLKKYTYPFDPACDPAANDPVNYSGTGDVNGCGPDIFGNFARVSGSAFPVDVDEVAGTVTYKAGSITLDRVLFFLGCGSTTFASIAIQAADGTGYTLGGVGTVVLSRAPSKNPHTFVTRAHFDSGQAPAAPDSAQVIDMRDVVVHTLYDQWDVDKQYHPATCGITQADNSERKQGWGNEPDQNLEINGSVSLLDFEGRLEESLTRTIRGLAGDEECVGGVLVIGNRTETLSDEDTETDAEIRSGLSAMAYGGAACQSIWTLRGAAEYSFLKRYAQVKLRAGSEERPLVIGATYEGTIFFRVRVAGSGGPFLPHSYNVGTFVADDFIEIYPHPHPDVGWIEVPIELGMEIKATGCSVRLVAPPPP